MSSANGNITKELLTGGVDILKHPPYGKMNTHDRLLRVAMMAYAKHTLDIVQIGWQELGEALGDELANTVGGDTFAEWVENISAEDR
jgi:hypothetical protein